VKTDSASTERGIYEWSAKIFDGFDRFDLQRQLQINSGMQTVRQLRRFQPMILLDK
jgi:hypothetical protein